LQHLNKLLQHMLKKDEYMTENILNLGLQHQKKVKM
jgi:hypothetical protein